MTEFQGLLHTAEIPIPSVPCPLVDAVLFRGFWLAAIPGARSGRAGTDAVHGGVRTGEPRVVESPMGEFPDGADQRSGSSIDGEI